MTFLDLEGNEVLDMDMFYEFISHTKKLLSINMLDNPINFNKNYKIVLLSTCPKIVQIDEVYINPHVREGFRVMCFPKLDITIRIKIIRSSAKDNLKL